MGQFCATGPEVETPTGGRGEQTSNADAVHRQAVDAPQGGRMGRVQAGNTQARGRQTQDGAHSGLWPGDKRTLAKKAAFGQAMVILKGQAGGTA